MFSFAASATRLPGFCATLSLLLLAVLPVPSVRAQGNSEALLKRFRAEAPQAWKIVDAADESPGTIKMTSRIVTRVQGKITNTQEKTAVIHRKAGHYLYKFEKEAKEIVFARNPEYRFAVMRHPEKNGWVVAEKILFKGRPGFDEMDPALIEYVRPNGYAFINLLGPLSRLVDNDRFKAMRAEILSSGLIRVHCQNVIAAPKQDIKVDGWMDFDPANSWVMCASVGTGSLGGHVKLKKTFSGFGNAFRPCESWETVSIDGNSETTQKTDFEVVDKKPVPDRSFYMSAFDLPEPKGVNAPSPSRWYLWFIGFAFVSLGIGWYLRRRARLRGAMKAPGSATS